MKPETAKINRDEFISIVLHQLRTPLTGSLWAHEMMLNGDMGQINDEQQHYLTLSHESIRLALASIGDILLYENSGPESTDYAFADTDFRALTEEMVYAMSPQAKKRNIHLSLNDDQTIPHVNIDRKKIGAVIQNLLENAIKYSRENSAIEVKLAKTANSVTLSVKDNGIGIPEKEQGLIFNRFFRASNAEEQEEGMGIGLYIGKHIVDSHRGKLSFTSSAGQGTTFYLELPLKS